MWREIVTEAGVLGVFLLGLLASRLLRRRWHPAEIVVMYLVGLLFEVLTAHLWNYHHVFLVYPFRVDTDISILFPLGWAGLIMATAAVAEAGWRRWNITAWPARVAWAMVASLPIGDIPETLFYRVGMIEYVRSPDSRIVFLFGQAPGLPPTLVLLGYAINLPVFVYFFRWLESGLARKPGRRGS